MYCLHGKHCICLLIDSFVHFKLLKNNIDIVFSILYFFFFLHYLLLQFGYTHNTRLIEFNHLVE